MKSHIQRTLSSYVYEELVQKITSGQYREGQKLPSEGALGRQFKSSRPVIRAALLELREQGFIETTKGVGSFVRRTRNHIPNLLNITPLTGLEDILLCYDYRIAFEGACAYHAALNSNASDKISIQRAFDISESAFLKGNQNSFEADINFHLSIAEATHNRFFPQAMQAIQLQMKEGMSSIVQYFDDNPSRQRSMKNAEHSLVLEAILVGDARMAKAAMELHLQRARKWITPRRR